MIFFLLWRNIKDRFWTFSLHGRLNDCHLLNGWTQTCFNFLRLSFLFINMIVMTNNTESVYSAENDLFAIILQFNILFSI